MAGNVKPVPEGYHTATPYLIVKDAAKAIEFYKQAFGATELMRMSGPGGKIMHAEIRIGDSIIMMGDENPQMGSRSPQSTGGSPVGLYLYVEDCDKVFNQAVSTGATSTHLDIAGGLQPIRKTCQWTRFANAPPRDDALHIIAGKCNITTDPEPEPRRLKDYSCKGADTGIPVRRSPCRAS